MPLLLDGDRRAGTRRARPDRRPTRRWTARSAATAPPSARIDIALHDLVGKVVGVPVHVLLGLSADLPPTDFTIGIDEPAVVAERARRAADFPALKIKVGGPADLATLRAVREVYAGPIRVDANTGWTRADAAGAAARARRPRRRAHRAAVPGPRLPRPRLAPGALVAADRRRRVVRPARGPRRARRASSPGSTSSSPSAAASARRTGCSTQARASCGFRTFLGCMEETSVGIAASAVVASLADWVDLDGNLLLADDPFEGLELGPDKRWRLRRPARASG